MLPKGKQAIIPVLPAEYRRCHENLIEKGLAGNLVEPKHKHL